MNRGLAARIILAVVPIIVPGCLPLTRPGSPTETIVVVRPGPPARHLFNHAFVIVKENHEYDQIIGSPDAPYINQLARTYGLATNYFAVSLPSLPNYLALISGSTQGLAYDCSDCSFDSSNLVDQLERQGITWKAYVESLPRPCFDGASSGSVLDWLNGTYYVRRHNPFTHFRDISSNPAGCGRIVPFEQLASDLQSNTVADFVWITPNLAHDMHNGSVAAGDRWLAANLPAILRSPAWQDNGAIFLLWDEGTTSEGCCGVSGGHVPLLVITPDRAAKRSATPYTHYSVLRTLEEAWGLNLLGHSGDAENQPVLDLLGG